MQIHALGLEDRAAIRREEGGRGFEEEEGSFRACAGKLGDMVSWRLSAGERRCH